MDDSWDHGFKGEKAEFRPEGQKELYMENEGRRGCPADSIRFKYPG